MFRSLLLLVASFVAATAHAETVISSSWSYSGNQPTGFGNFASAIPVARFEFTSQYFGNGPMYPNPFSVDSITLQGVTILPPHYTSIGSTDFTITIKDRLLQGNPIVGQAALTSWTNLGTTIYGGSNVFSLTFGPVTGQPLLPIGGSLTGLWPGSYEIYLNIVDYSEHPSTVMLDGFTPTSPSYFEDPYTGRYENDGSYGFTWGGPLYLSMDATMIPLPGVPEPSTYGLMAGALALAAVAVRRRKAKRA